jgi:hypothetical protein
MTQFTSTKNFVVTISMKHFKFIFVDDIFEVSKCVRYLLCMIV